MQHILVTGGAGFIGSHFIKHCLEHQPYHVINIDSLTYAGDLNNLSDIEQHQNYTFIKGDITDKALIEQLFVEYNISGVIHFAAESHVDNSIHGPAPFIETNIVGTFTLLEAARRHWVEKHQPHRFFHISTDEVYGTLGPSGFFTETTPYAPNSPYSASKASSDMLVRAYHHTYGLNTLTSNCSNNFGPHQHDEKLIPTIIRNALQEKPIPIYGNGQNIRDWLYVKDHCDAIDFIFHHGLSGEVYNIGTKNEQTNLEIAHLICQILDTLHPRANGQSYQSLIAFVEDRKGHDYRYAIDASKLHVLGWQANSNFEQTLRETIRWYLSKYISEDINQRDLQVS